MSGMLPFGAVLRRYRTRAHLSQERLAEMADVHHSSVSRLEAGSRAPSRRMTLCLAEVLAVSDAERDDLLAAGGFAAYGVALDTRTTIEPLALALHELLSDPTVADVTKRDVRYLASQLIRMARDGRHTPSRAA